jgi:hypothetical protein
LERIPVFLLDLYINISLLGAINIGKDILIRQGIFPGSMAREIVQPEMFFVDNAMQLEGKEFMQGHATLIMPWLTFNGDHHFEAMACNSQSRGYPTGYFKTGTIRYRPDQVIFPATDHMLLFETGEFHGGKPPRGFTYVHHVVVSPLEELTDEEIMEDGFADRKDMMWQMTEMEGRHYKDLKPTSLVSYVSFSGLSRLWLGDLVDLMPFIALYRQGDYWDVLRQMDKVGWTEAWNEKLMDFDSATRR